MHLLQKGRKRTKSINERKLTDKKEINKDACIYIKRRKGNERKHLKVISKENLLTIQITVTRE